MINDSNYQRAELIERDAWLDLFDAAPVTVRAQLGLASDIINGIGVLGCRALPITELNRAMAIGADREPLRQELEAVVAWLDAHATDWALQIAPTVTGETLRAFIDDAGLVETGAGWAKFVGTAAAPALPDAGGEIEIRQVDAASAAPFGRAVAGGFGLPDSCAEWFAALPERSPWRCSLAMIDGEAAGGAMMYLQNDAAWFGIQGTLDRYRNRGVQQRLIVEQTRIAIAEGATLLTSETSQPQRRDDAGFSSYRNQERAGLTRAYTRADWKRGT